MEYAAPTCPAGIVVVVIRRVVTAAAMVMVKVCVAVCAVGVVESVTLAVKENEPEAVGVPETAPAVERVKPAGNAPALTLQLYGVVPPEAANEVEYAAPT